MAYEIYISNYDRTKVLQLPIVPSEFPTLSSDSKNEEFETYWNGDYNLIEKSGLQQFTLESWLPRDASKYYFCKSKINAREIIDLIENAKTNAEPIRIIINDKTGYYVNDTFSVEKFEYKIIKRGDYEYSLGVKQFRDYNTTITPPTILGWNKDNTGWWYVIDANGNYYKDSWQLINNYWYYFNSTGYIKVSEWFKNGNKWYYFGSDGAMWFGASASIDGKEYTFNDDGSLVE